jgi:hypothetical protein
MQRSYIEQLWRQPLRRYSRYEPGKRLAAEWQGRSAVASCSKSETLAGGHHSDCNVRLWRLRPLAIAILVTFYEVASTPVTGFRSCVVNAALKFAASTRIPRQAR